MYVYTPGQWALLFFFYCFCGWVWESCYVSAKQRHWVNRGFLHGPLLPIYGSGAIIILFATLPVADNFWLVYFLGMLAATALEYVVGAVMEQLFKVRYWDYTKQPFNLHGYICLTSSIAWGFFSDLLIYVIHPPIDKLLHKLPALLVNPLAAVIAVLFIMDTVKSTKAAIDLREVLTKLTEENAELRRLAKKAEAAQARTAEELQAFREKTSLDRYLLQSYLADELEAHRTAKQVRKQRRRAALENAFRRRVESKLEILANIAQALEKTRAALDDGIDEPGEQELAKHREELDALIAMFPSAEEAGRICSPLHQASGADILMLLMADPATANETIRIAALRSWPLANSLPIEIIRHSDGSYHVNIEFCFQKIDAEMGPRASSGINARASFLLPNGREPLQFRIEDLAVLFNTRQA